MPDPGRACPSRAPAASGAPEPRNEPRAAAPEKCCGARPAQARRPKPAFRHADAVELAGERVLLIVMQRQLGHSNVGITSVYLQGIDNAEIIETVHARRQPMIPVNTSH
jgi:hypothetical protein